MSFAAGLAVCRMVYGEFTISPGCCYCMHSRAKLTHFSVATIIAIHDILRYIHNITIQKQCSSCHDIGIISADMLTN